MENVVVDDSMSMMGVDGGIVMPTDVSHRSIGIGMIFPRWPKRGIEARSWSTMASSTKGKANLQCRRLMTGFPSSS